MSYNQPMFSIITPTLMRESLVRCCESINEQQFSSWEHIIFCDSPSLDTELIKQIEHPQRHIFCCGERHGNYGNHCRWLAWEQATAPWVWMVDDDNYLATTTTLQEIKDALEGAGSPSFGLFPILRHGRWFFYDPPGLCYVDTMNIVCNREIGRWPDIEAREADGHWVEALKAQYSYAAFPNNNVIGIMEHSSNGV